MNHVKSKGLSDDWYTPKYIFDAMGVHFDLDVASPPHPTNVPCSNYYYEGSLDKCWTGFVWMNPPYGDFKNKKKWLSRFVSHGNGICLMPDRTSASWFTNLMQYCDCLLIVNHKIKFINKNGEPGGQPSNGSVLFGIGQKSKEALLNAEKNNLGKFFIL